MSRRALAGMVIPLVALLVWAANFWLPPLLGEHCSLARVKLEAHLLLAALAVTVLPIVGLPLAASSLRRDRLMSVIGLALNTTAALLAASMLLGWVALKGPCLRS